MGHQGTDLLTGIDSEADAVYVERNKLVALLARIYPSGIKRTAIEGWDPEWHSCVYIDLPTGQVSFHYHDRQAALFDRLPDYQGEWDGHSTRDKYERIMWLMDSLEEEQGR